MFASRCDNAYCSLRVCALSFSLSLGGGGGKGILSSTSFSGLSILFVHFVNPAVFFLFCFPPSSLMLWQLFLCLMVDAIFMSIILVPMRSERVSLSFSFCLSFIFFCSSCHCFFQDTCPPTNACPSVNIICVSFLFFCFCLRLVILTRVLTPPVVKTKWRVSPLSQLLPS